MKILVIFLVLIELHIKEDSVQNPSQKIWIPRFRRDGPFMRLDAHQCLLFKLASIQISQQHVRTLFRVREESSI
jgi:hypothetical protein